jgi:hypothetical protein
MTDIEIIQKAVDEIIPREINGIKLQTIISTTHIMSTEHKQHKLDILAVNAKFEGSHMQTDFRPIVLDKDPRKAFHDYGLYTKYVDNGVSALFVEYTKNLIKVTKEK